MSEDLMQWQSMRDRVKAQKKNGNGFGMPLAVAVRLWPTPAATEGRLGYQRRPVELKGTQQSLSTAVIDSEGGRTATSGQLNPTWVEWLMGFPLGWTDLKDSETP